MWEESAGGDLVRPLVPDDLASANLEPWDPLTVGQVATLLVAAPFPWWIAGGWAIDLFLSHQTRPHDDLDVVVLRRDQLAVQEASAGWDLWAADPPGSLRPWSTGELLPSRVHDVWCRRVRSSPWCLQLMLADTDGDRWLFRRDQRVTAPLSRIGRRTGDGIPFISPEMQLLFKSGRERHPKNELDFAAALPLLDARSRQWLTDALTLTRLGHPWLARLAL